MLELTSLGTIHTALSLVAVAAGFGSLLVDRAISPRTDSGRVYIGATVLVCLSSLGIFQHGGFGKPHVLALLTLLVLGLAALAAGSRLFGRAAPYVEIVSYSLSFFFHMIPGLTETFTRLPIGAPLFSGPEDPLLQKLVGLCFLLFLVGAALQLRTLRAELRHNSAPALARARARA